MTTTLLKKHDFDMVFDSLKIFRLVLEAISHPAREVSIQECADKLQGSNTSFLAVAMTLLDNETTYNTCKNLWLSDEISSLTHARRASVEKADFVFVYDPDDLEEVITNAKSGTLANPHENATIIIRNVQNIPASMHQLTFFGPGMDIPATLRVTPTIKKALALRDTQNFEYPQGLDLLFISDEGILLAIPRLVRIGQATGDPYLLPAQNRSGYTLRRLFEPELRFEGTD